MLKVKLEDLVEYVEGKIYDPEIEYRGVFIDSDYVYRLGIEIMTPITSLAPGRVMIMGESEKYYLKTFELERRKKILNHIFSKKFSALFLANGLNPGQYVFDLAKKYLIPIFTVKDKSSILMSELTNFLEERLEPSITRPAGLMSVHGEGVLLTGESGVGKSEVALELIHRGHKFVSDDLTEIKKISTKTLLGSPPGNISKFIEVRGIGIINVQQLFGINAIKKSENIDMIVHFEQWKDGCEYDRLGSVEYFVKILDISIPYISIPVKPGKNLAVLVEIAAMNNRMKKYGMNPYGELMGNLCGINDLVPKEFKQVLPMWDKQ